MRPILTTCLAEATFAGTLAMAPAVQASEYGDATRQVCLPFAMDGLARDEAIRRGRLTASTKAKAEPFSFGLSGLTEIGLEDKDRVCNVKMIIKPGEALPADMAPSRVRTEVLAMLRARGFKPVRNALDPSPFAFRDAFCSPEGGPQYIALISTTADGATPVAAVFLTVAGSPNRDPLC